MKPNKNRARDLGFYALILVILLATVFTMSNTATTYTIDNYSDVVTLFEDEQVQSFIVEGGELIIDLYEPLNSYSTVVHTLYDVDYFREDLGDLIAQQYADGIITYYDYDEGFIAPWWVSFLPYLLVIVVMGVLWYVMMNKAGGGGTGSAAKFSKARTRLAGEDAKKITFADVAGCDEEKEELEEIVSFLKNPQKYTDMGARIPKGVLLVGPPGTGKTLIARAVAGEAGVQFLSISGSDFVELYVGVGASRVRDLFEQAKKAAPAIIFIDEIDAVGRQRGSGLGGGHDEREQTLNQLLVEMDGFTNNEGVIVIAATNRSDILDNALLRPGRFDRRVYVGLPDVRGREAILKVHSRGKPLGDDVDLASVARGTAGFSGADLENLMNEAALMAVSNERRFITAYEIEEAIRKVGMGPEKKSKAVSDRSKKLTAYHEAGHAVAGNYLEHVDPVHYITIIPRGMSGGATYFRPSEVEDFKGYNELYEQIVMALGGRISERLFLDDISTGASADIQQATEIARNMVTIYGMSSKLGPISYDSSGHSIFIGRDFGQTKSYSEETAALIDGEIKDLFESASAQCEKILLEHADIIHGLVGYLLENESMEGEDFTHFCETGELPAYKPAPAPPEQEPTVAPGDPSFELRSDGDSATDTDEPPSRFH